MNNYLPKLPFVFYGVTIFAIFTMSGDLLTLLGYNFALEGGSFIYKIHPSFYLLFITFVSFFIYRDGFRFIFNVFFNEKNFYVILLCFFCFIYQAFFLGQPMAPFFVTWLTPVLLIFLFPFLSEPQKLIIKKLLICLISINAVMGLIEYALGSSIVPNNYYDMDNSDFVDVSDWGFERSSALYGHPLVASFVSAIVTIGLFSKSLYFRLSSADKVCLTLSILSLPAFGGRFSILIVLVFCFLFLFLSLYRVLNGHQVDRKNILLASIMLIFIPLVLFFLFNIGLFDSLISRVMDDNGSAESRLTAMYIMFDTSFSEIILGDYNSQLFIRQMLYGTKYGIEIFWVALILQLGLLFSTIMFYVLFYIIKHINFLIGKHTILSSISFLFIVSSGTGLASKTLMLSQFLLISLFIFYPFDDE